MGRPVSEKDPSAEGEGRPTEAERPRLLTLYFEYPNDISHDLGPEAPGYIVGNVVRHIRKL